MDNQLRTLDHAQATLVEMAVRFGPRIVVALLFLVAGMLVARMVGRAADRTLVRIQLEPPARMLLVRLVRVLVVGLFLILALQNLGVELLPLIAGLGVAGAGVALATQGVLSNVVAGLTIIFTKPYRLGESIAIVGVDGTVESISLFNTVLLHADRSRVVVPNRKIVGEILHNYGRMRQTGVSVGVAYGSDLAAALAAVDAVVRAHPRVLSEPAPVIQVSALGRSAIEIAARPWVAVADFGAVEGELNVQIVAALRQRGIQIPVAQHEVRLLRPARVVA